MWKISSDVYTIINLHQVSFMLECDHFVLLLFLDY